MKAQIRYTEATVIVGHEIIGEMRCYGTLGLWSAYDTNNRCITAWVSSGEARDALVAERKRRKESDATS